MLKRLLARYDDGFSFDDGRRRSFIAGLGVVGGILALTRIVVVILWTVVGDHLPDDNLWISLLLSVLSRATILTIVGIAGLVYWQRRSAEPTYERMAGSLTTYAIATLVLLLLAAIIPYEYEPGSLVPSTSVSVITGNVIAVGSYAIACGLAAFLVQQLLSRRHESTKSLLIAQTVLLAGIWLMSTMADLHRVYSLIGFLLFLGSAFVLLFNIRRLQWIVAISLDRKIRLLWLTLCGAFASFILAAVTTFGKDTTITLSLEHFLTGGATMLSVVHALGFIFFIRFLFAVVAALPNSGLVDRRSSEIESLTTLNRLIAESTNISHLLVSVTQFALRVCRAHGAWCELYEEDGSVRIVGTQLVSEDYVRLLRRDPGIRSVIAGADVPTSVPSMTDQLGRLPDGAMLGSVISIPIVGHAGRCGTLVVFSTIDYGFEPDDLRVLTAFGDQINLALDQERLWEASRERERMQREFDVARRIQVSLLPRTAPTIGGLDVDAVMVPAADVGGDYFDYVRFANGRPGAIIADVSGKGIPAALYMATLKGAVLAEMRQAEGPADLLRRINTTLFGSMERGAYITMTCVEFDAEGGRIRLARAGHTPTVLRRSGVVTAVAPPGMAIGIVGPALFDGVIADETIDVAAGDVCLLTTDGVTERRDPHLAEISIDPVLDLVQGGPWQSATDLVAATWRLLDAHGAGADPHDDITIVALLMTGPTVTTADLLRTPTILERLA